MIHREHGEAVALARANRFEEALAILYPLLADEGSEEILHDTVLILSWAGRDREILRLRERIEPNSAPIYALEAVARAARNLHKPALAAPFYEVILARQPDHDAARIGLLLSRAELGDAASAETELNALLSKDPDNLELQLAMTHVGVYGEWWAALRRKGYSPNDDQQRVAPLPADTPWPRNAKDLYDAFKQAVATARTGPLGEAMQTLDCFFEETPHNQWMLPDYLVVLSWADRFDRVMALAPRVDPDKVPVYTLEAMARSARALRNTATAEAWFNLAVQRAPDRVEPRVGLLLCQLDHGQDQIEIEMELRRLHEKSPRNLNVLWALAYLAEYQGKTFIELTWHQKILEIDADNTPAKRALALNLSQLGAPETALDFLEASPRLDLDARQIETIMGDRAAQWVQWGELRQPTIEQRFAETDFSIDLLNINVATNEPFEEARDKERFRAEFDRLVALRDRALMQAVLDRYEALEDDQQRLPPYALISVADAYLYLRQPDKARDAYQQVLEQTPHSFNPMLSLYYALLEGEDNDTALEHIHDLADEQPIWFSVGDTRVRARNDRKTSAALTADMAQAYAGRLHVAQKRLERKRMIAPYNQTLRSNLANIYFWRGWPRKAVRQYDLVLANLPLLGAKVWRVHTLMALNRLDEAPLLVEELYQQFPEDTAVQQLKRDWDSFRGFHLHSEAIFSEGPGNNIATNELTWDTYLWGPFFKHWYRPFAHHYYASADFLDGSVHYRRWGAGLRWQRRDFTAQLEAHADDIEGANLGWTGNASWRLDDYWHFSAQYSSYSNDVPLKGRLVGLTGRDLTLAALYRASDRRNLRANYKWAEFSDGNTRKSLSALGFQTLYSGPRYRLFGEAEVYTSNNDLRNRIYFNPERDLSYGLSLDNRFLHYRRYDRKFNHRLVLHAGNYWQEGFGTDWIGTIRYEHHWDLDSRKGFLYGVSRSRRVFDGNPEYATNFYATLNWRF